MNDTLIKNIRQYEQRDENDNVTYTIEDLYTIYDKYKVRSLIKILNDDSYVDFYDEENSDSYIDSSKSNYKI